MTRRAPDASPPPRRTRRWLRAATIAVLLTGGTWLTGMALAQAVGAWAWQDDRVGASRTAWRLLPADLGLVEPDVGATSDGLAAYSERRFGAARDHFDRALDAAPSQRRCGALRNLVLALEASAGARDGANDAFVQEREYRRALRELDRAPRCSADDATDRASARELVAARERIESRRRYVAPSGSFIDQQETRYATIAVERESIAERQQRLQGFQREAQQNYVMGGLLGRNADAAPVDDGDPRW